MPTHTSPPAPPRDPHQPPPDDRERIVVIVETPPPTWPSLVARAAIGGLLAVLTGITL